MGRPIWFLKERANFSKGWVEKGSARSLDEPRRSIADFAPGFRATARSRNTPLTAMEDSRKGLYGLQFHPEVVHTLEGYP